MHWSEEIAQKIIERNPNKEEYVCAAGISPSGSIHIGNFRDIATSYFVVKALRKMGKKARLLFSWDEFDRLRKVPVNVAAVTEGFEKHIGQPYVDAPDPFGCCESYAKHFQNEFEASIKRFGIEMDYRYQASEYRSGRYAKQVIHALKNRERIFEILDSFRTQDATEEERKNYYPVGIYCAHCGKDTTKITSLSDDCKVAEYECECGHKGSFNFETDFNCKLAWKIDWPMRWMAEGVDFEPGGKDHASPTGSYQTSRIIAKEIFGYEAPLFQGYEFIGIKGTTGKMSGSSGLNLTPDTLLKLYDPEIILWLYSKTEPTKAFNFCFDDEILRQYFEFDRMMNAYVTGKADEHIASIMEGALIEGRTAETVSMQLLVSLGSIVDFNVPMLETVFEKIGTPYKYEEFKERLDRAKFWLFQCSPESVNKLRETRNFEVYNELDEQEKQAVKMLFDYLSKDGYTLDDLNTELYAIPKRIYGEDMDQKTLKGIQGKFFKNVYRLLIDKEQGPRLYLFLFAVEKDRYVRLLDFAHPQTEEEKELDAKEKAEAEAKAKAEEPKADPIKEQITIDEFDKVDMRVCKILKAEEIKKSHSCLKLTLDDGLEGRVIVSSIKNEYTPEQLVGKKIIVIANLKPAKFSGVQSNGMLIAATHEDCGCKVIFVDDAVPTGTAIH
ncbi:MAG: lysine--tRNA ligase [Clostridia bacterium]|nr:lysine--tRNA ligase [Clostridia bacterium]